MQSKIIFVCIFFIILQLTLINQFGSCNVYPNYVRNRFYPPQRQRGGRHKGHGHHGSGGHHRVQQEVLEPPIASRPPPVPIPPPEPTEAPITIPVETPKATAPPQAPGSTNVNSTNNASALNNQATNIIINLKEPGPTPEECPKSFLGTVAKIMQGTPCLEP